MTTLLALNGNHPTTDTDPEFDLTHTESGKSEAEFDEAEFDEAEFDDEDEHLQPAAALEDDDEAFAPSMDLARLTGYDTTAEVEALPPSVLLDDDSDDAPVVSAASLDSGDDEEGVIDPRAVKTKHGIIGSPFTKLAVVGAGTLVVIMALGLFLSSVMGGKDAKTPVASATPTPSPTTEALSPQSDEVALYKTQSALTRQKELLNDATPPKPLPTTKPVANTAPSPIPLANPMPMPAAPAMSVLSTPTTLPTEAPVDPMEKWRMAATMGSYGQVPSASAGGSSYNASNNVPVPVAPAYVPPAVPVSSNNPAGSRPLSQLRASTSVPGLRDRPLSSVLVGTTATSQTTTAVVMTGDNTTPIAPDSPAAIKYLAKLNAGLNDAAGNVAIPAGSQVVMVARSFSPQTGLAEFVVTSVIVDNKEYAVPKDTLVVRGSNGGLVAFSKRSTNSGRLFTALLPAFFAGVSQAGQVLNQPTSSSSVSGGNVSATTSTSNPSPVAGFAQGFSQNLATGLQQKAQAANQAAASAPVSWQLNAGSEVKVFVNSSFEM